MNSVDKKSEDANLAAALDHRCTHAKDLSCVCVCVQSKPLPIKKQKLKMKKKIFERRNESYAGYTRIFVHLCVWTSFWAWLQWWTTPEKRGQPNASKHTPIRPRRGQPTPWKVDVQHLQDKSVRKVYYRNVNICTMRGRFHCWLSWQEYKREQKRSMEMSKSGCWKVEAKKTGGNTAGQWQSKENPPKKRNSFLLTHAGRANQKTDKLKVWTNYFFFLRTASEGQDMRVFGKQAKGFWRAMNAENAKFYQKKENHFAHHRRNFGLSDRIWSQKV